MLGDKRLAVNCDASNGELIVEVLDERGDVVEWREGHISSLGQAAIRLRFFLDNADLYSFTSLD